MNTQKLTTDIIQAAIDGFEVQKTRIDAQIAELRGMLAGGGHESAAPAGSSSAPVKKHGISAAGRRAIAEAQRKRWALAKKNAQTGSAAEAPKPKRQLSAAGRKRIAEATKRRWALVRAQKAAAAN